MGNFRKDLERGKEVERELQRHLGGDLSKGRCSTHDLLIESKDDRKSYETGNVAFEIECNGKPSGVLATESEWWIVRLGSDDLGKHVYYYRQVSGLADWLRELCREKRARQIKGGDGFRSRMVLVPLSEFILEFRQLLLERVPVVLMGDDTDEEKKTETF